MKILTFIKTAIPFIILFILLCLLGQQLYSARPMMPSMLTGSEVPSFSVENLLSPSDTLSNDDLRGRVTLVNIWATWCEGCMEEHSFLMKIKDQYHIPIYGIDYKDKPDAAKQWLQKHGNPYVKVGSDTDGSVAVDFGIYGTPETFIIDRNGQIVYRQFGSINQDIWDSLLYPIILKYQNEN